MYPARFALILSIVDIIYLVIFFKESLPEERRNPSTSATLLQAYSYLDPLQLFKFASFTNLGQKQHKIPCANWNISVLNNMKNHPVK